MTKGFSMHTVGHDELKKVELARHFPNWFLVPDRRVQPLDQPPFENPYTGWAIWHLYTTLILRTRGHEPGGVIHVGAHKGEDLLPYLLAGFKRVLLIEPQRKVVDDLRANADAVRRIIEQVLPPEARSTGDFEITVVECAVGAEAGTTEFFETNMTLNSSVKQPDKGELTRHNVIMAEASNMPATAVVPTEIVGRYEVEVRTIDDILAEHCADWWKRGSVMMTMNIQGAELDCLRGASESLEKLDAVQVEVSDFDRPRYQDEPDTAAIAEFLEARQFAPSHEWKVLPHLGMRTWLRTK